MVSNQTLSVGGWPVTIATNIFWAMLFWVAFLIFDYRRRMEKPSVLKSFLLLGHIWLASLFLTTAKIAESYQDPVLIWYAFLLVFRYYKTVVHLMFYFQYKPAVVPADFALSSADVTAVVPTVGPADNDTFADMVSGILYNQPQRLIFSTVTEDAKGSINAILPGILTALENGTSAYQVERNIPSLKTSTDIQVISASVASKREQFVRSLDQVDTLFIASADDTAVWNPNFLSPKTIAAFSEGKVALVGTRKWVKRLPRPSQDPSLSWITNAWNKYCFGFWNAIGATYLIRHNFEACAANAADGGIFAISGRTFLVRSHVVQDKKFQHAFLNEYILGGKVGPITADDDNFLTRWVINHNMDIKFQNLKEATITVVLGKEGGWRFKDQCLRWSRTTMRQNPQVLLLDRTAWWRHPLTIWTTYLPWLYNAALVWDLLMVGTLSLTNYWQECEHRFALMAGLIGFIWATKLIKIAPWFWTHPEDFFLYFFPAPVWLLFIYGHSILKIFTILTFWDLNWTGRKLPTAAKPKKKVV